MRILFVSNSFPSNLVTKVNGVFQRMRLFIDAIKEMAQLDMLFYVPSETDLSGSAVAALERTFSRHWNAELRLFLCPRVERHGAVSRWQLYGASAANFFRQQDYVGTSGPQQIQALEACLAEKPDAIFAHRLASMCPLLLTRKALPPIFFDLDDIEHVAFVRGIDPRWRRRTKLLHYLRVPALWWGERRAIQLARRTFVCSERDRDHLTNRWRLRGVATIPNAITVSPPLPMTPDPSLLFLGSYGYAPNARAAEFLIEAVWPRIQRDMPEARLIIAGEQPERIGSYDCDMPNVEFPGFVDDLPKLYERSRVVCAPILSGSGTRIKIIEAASYGRPIVATHVGAEGLHMRDGDELLLRDDPDSFADACLSLLNDASRCEALGSAAHAHVARQYDRAQTLRFIQWYLQA